MLFDKKISILVPYQSDGGYRDRNWYWVKKRYETLMPNAEICIGNYDNEPFSRSIAINNAAKLATRDIFIIADSDIIFDMNQIAKAILALCDFTWVIPYSIINYLTLQQTNRLQKMKSDVIINNIGFTDYVKSNYYNVGGITILKREHFEKVNGFDERFKGWGYEDNAFQRAMDTLCGPYGRVNNSLWHMYHEPAPQNNAQDNSNLFKKFYENSYNIK